MLTLLVVALIVVGVASYTLGNRWARTAAGECIQLQKEWGIVPHHNWGFSPPWVQEKWKFLECDIGHIDDDIIHHGEAMHLRASVDVSVLSANCDELDEKYGSLALITGRSRLVPVEAQERWVALDCKSAGDNNLRGWQDEDFGSQDFHWSADMDEDPVDVDRGTPAERELECNELQQTYGIVPLRSWGNLTSFEGQDRWGWLGCDVSPLKVEAWINAGFETPSAVKVPQISLSDVPMCTKAEGSLLSSYRMPAAILEAAVQLFDTCEALSAVVQRVEWPTSTQMIAQLNVTVKMRAFSDSPNYGLDSEMQGDRYGLLDIARNPALIVDAGTSSGSFSIMSAILHPTAQVLSFEPQADQLLLLLWNTAANNIPVLTMSDLGKPNKPGILALHGSMVETAAISSHHDPAAASLAQDQKGPAYNLPSELSARHAPAVSLLKLDCAGCESVVAGPLSEWIGDHTQVLRVSGELHWPKIANGTDLEQAQAQRESVYRTLEGRGCAGIAEFKARGAQTGEATLPLWC